jgi:hypothetical protein
MHLTKHLTGPLTSRSTGLRPQVHGPFVAADRAAFAAAWAALTAAEDPTGQTEGRNGHPSGQAGDCPIDMAGGETQPYPGADGRSAEPAAASAASAGALAALAAEAAALARGLRPACEARQRRPPPAEATAGGDGGSGGGGGRRWWWGWWREAAAPRGVVTSVDQLYEQVPPPPHPSPQIAVSFTACCFKM